ncbi:protein-glutamine glutaminase family protein [Bdellovibrio svalbardensis]|uniref:Protein-glutamine glutaminase family protein n=1 Tax=Bdellovibrio svalbardensis TaxID=2972972 RepID=A0ABT6DI73_9BACT|nr:protein-glutamine glutaminase family protein [Bdellovibrio svalbardensis]MDG0814803.1 protein-glutamine glutaminase family protein [Bdellovibrio svalbardensis]
MILRILLLALIVLAASMPIPDAFDESHNVDVTVITQQRADELFAEFKSHTEIPFGFPIDGCYARATAMARIAEAEKIEMGKVWATGILRVKSKDPTFPEIEWGYHVAPVLYVKAPTGEAKLMVFDPSLFDKPVTVDEWTDKMKAEGIPKAQVKKVYYGARFQYGPLKSEDKKYNWHTEDLKDAKEVMEQYSGYLKIINMRRLGSGKATNSQTQKGVN